MFAGFIGGWEVVLLLPIFMVGLLCMAFWVWMLVDAIRNKGLTDTEKLIWVVVIVFTHFLGAVIYFFAGRSKNIPRAT